MEIVVSAYVMKLFFAVIMVVAISPFVYTVKMDITRRFGQPQFINAEVYEVLVETLYPGGFEVTQRVKVECNDKKTKGKLNGKWIPAPMSLICKPHDKVKVACLAGKLWVVHPNKYYE